MNILSLPILLPFFMAVFFLFYRRHTLLRRHLARLYSLFHLMMMCFIFAIVWKRNIVVLQIGEWSVPFGIVLVVDVLSCIMMSLAGLLTASAIWYRFFQTSFAEENPLWLPLVFFFLGGLNMAFSTGDLFNLFVSFEIVLICSYALLTLDSSKKTIKYAFPYLTINMFTSFLFLIAVGYTYHLFGTLNYADLSRKSFQLIDDPRLTTLAYLFVVIFGVKSAMFPLFYWLPKSYAVLSFSTGALFAGSLTKLGVYSFLRIFGNVFPHELIEAHQAVFYLSAPTMLVAVLGATAQNSIRELLSWHIISQIGYMLLGFSFFTHLGFAACLFHLIHNILVKSSLFLIGGVMYKLNHSENLKEMGGIWHTTPWVGLLFFFQAFSLAGVPPLSGFWGKYLIALEGIHLEKYTLVFVSLCTGFFTLFSMLKITILAFWQKRSKSKLFLEENGWKKMSGVCLVLVIISLFVGFGAEFVFQVVEKAAYQALDQQSYIQNVFAVVE